MATQSSILAWRIPMDREAWWTTIHGVTGSWTWLSDTAHKPGRILSFKIRKHCFTLKHILRTHLQSLMNGMFYSRGKCMQILLYVFQWRRKNWKTAGVIRLPSSTGVEQGAPLWTVLLGLISWDLLGPDQSVSIFGNTMTAGCLIIITLSYWHWLQSGMLNCSREMLLHWAQLNMLFMLI